MHIFTNFPKTTLAGSITELATSISVAPGTGLRFPNPVNGQYFDAVLETAPGIEGLRREVVRCTKRDLDLLTVIRGLQGTTSQQFSDGDIIQLSALKDFLESGAVSSDIQGNQNRYALLSGLDSKIGTLDPAPLDLPDGMAVVCRGGGVNTGAVVINFNSLGAVALKILVDGALSEMDAGDWHNEQALVVSLRDELISLYWSLRTAAYENEGAADADIPDNLTIEGTVRKYTKEQTAPSAAPEFDSGVLDWDLNLSQRATWLLEANVTTFNLLNPVEGATYRIRFEQDNPGGWTVAFPASILWPFGGTAPVVSSGVGAVDVLTLHYFDGEFYGLIAQDFQ